jgi:hypothetical protein
MGIALDTVNVTVPGNVVRKSHDGVTTLTLTEDQVREINRSTGKLLEFFDGQVGDDETA